MLPIKKLSTGKSESKKTKHSILSVVLLGYHTKAWLNTLEIQIGARLSNDKYQLKGSSTIRNSSFNKRQKVVKNQKILNYVTTSFPKNRAAS